MIALIALMLIVGGVAAYCSAEHREEQGARQRVAKALQLRGIQIEVSDVHNNSVTLTNKDAATFTAVARREFERTAKTSNALNYWHRNYRLTFKLEDGSTITIPMEGRGPYYIDEVDKWYMGTREFGFLCVTVFATLRIERGCADDEREDLHSRVESAYRYMNVSSPTRWENIRQEDVAVIAEWVKRYDSISGQPSIDTEDLLEDS